MVIKLKSFENESWIFLIRVNVHFLTKLYFRKLMHVRFMDVASKFYIILKYFFHL